MLAQFTDEGSMDLALRDSDGRYRALFDAIDEGFCVIQMIFDNAGRGVDYRFLEINPAFVRQTGFHGAVGKRMRELAPDLETHWFETFGRVALTGESRRFQNRAEALHRSYDVYAFRFGAPEARQVAILFNDITEREQAQAERLQLEQALRQSNTALEQRVRERTTKLRELADALERNNRELQDFTFVVSHDLQEPLRMIMYSATPDESSRRAARCRRTRTCRTHPLLSRPPASPDQRHGAVLPPQCINQAVREGEPERGDARCPFQHGNPDRAHRGARDCERAADAGAHPAQMHQLLSNLLGNALKFRRPGIAPLVKISAGRVRVRRCSRSPTMHRF